MRIIKIIKVMIIRLCGVCMNEKACKMCGRIIEEGNECVVCKNKNLTRNWKGILVIFDSDSELAKLAGKTSAGKYAVNIL